MSQRSAVSLFFTHSQLRFTLLPLKVNLNFSVESAQQDPHVTGQVSLTPDLEQRAVVDFLATQSQALKFSSTLNLIDESAQELQVPQVEAQ
jgi:hypothetical protein